jgi:von Willebrand factor type A domain-containing protein
MQHIHHAIGLGLLVGVAFASCKSDERPEPADNSIDNRRGNGGSSAATSDVQVEVTDAGSPDASQRVGCAAKVCRGPSSCVETNGVGICVCDEGYESVAVDGECVVDEDCIKLRLIEPGCRQRQGAEPAMAMLFDVATCAGTTVKPEVLGNVDTAFAVLENGAKLGDESFAAILERDVESYVVIAIDLSTSVADDSARLLPLREHLKELVRDLEPGPGESAVHVELITFGRSVIPAMAFSDDFAAIVSKLDQIFADRDAFVTDPNGTNLNGAINQGTRDLEDTLKQYLLTTGGGVVATGTVLSVTDGNDNSGVRLDARAARYNLISVGISSDVNYKELTRVGPQGSFLAPEPSDWEASFADVARRVAEYPKRSYLLAYCSPQVAGTYSVAVTWANGDAQANATCGIDAADFGVGQVCNGAFMTGYCADPDLECAGFLACGACTGSDAGSPETGWEFSK